MIQSTDIVLLSKALVKAQKAIEAAKKNSENKFFSSQYADLSSVVEAVKGPLNDNGLTYSQWIEEALPQAPDVLRITTMLLHESGQYLQSTAAWPVVKTSVKIGRDQYDIVATPQTFAAASTYARRVGLASVCGLTAEDDDGNAGSGNRDRDRPSTNRASTTRRSGVPIADEECPACHAPAGTAHSKTCSATRDDAKDDDPDDRPATRKTQGLTPGLRRGVKLACKNKGWEPYTDSELDDWTPKEAEVFIKEHGSDE